MKKRGLRPIGSACALLGLITGLAGPIQGARAEGSPFAIRSHSIRGVIRQAWPLRVGPCEHAATDLLVLSTDGGPPEETRIATWMPCGTAVSPGAPSIVERVLAPDTVVVDVARWPGRRGAQLLQVSADGLRIDALASADPPLRIAVAGGLPLPPRPWSIARVRVVDDWWGNGVPTALVPAPRGAWLIDLSDGEAKPIELPVFASYRTWMPDLPEVEWRWMVSEVQWPALARADDDGDGLRDLFALSRYAIWVYRSGPDGLSSEPDRRMTLVPFDARTELDHRATAADYWARDVDGDGRADLLLTTVGGGLMDGRTSTRIHLNSGDGADPARPAEIERVLEGGFSRTVFVDVDGDGRTELLETSIEFGVLQIVRFLLTRRAETRVRLLTVDLEVPGGLRTLFEDDLSFRLDFGGNQVEGLVPTLGDWNGDGQLDFYVADGDQEIALRLGSKAADHPLFGDIVARQPVPLPGGESRIADLDGDGLDEIVAFSDRDPALPLVVLENLGRLPGTRPSLSAAEDDPAASAEPGDEAERADSIE